MKSFTSSLFLAALLVASPPMVARVPTDDPFSWLEKISRSCNYSHPCMRERALQFLENENCDQKEAAACILLTLNPRTLDDVLPKLNGCDLHFYMLHHVQGTVYYGREDWDDALQQFVYAEEEGMQPMGVVEVNQGACYFAMEAWDYALPCMEEAWDKVDAASVEVRYMVLNNLAALYLEFEEPEMALKWIQLAKENWSEFKSIRNQGDRDAEAFEHSEGTIIPSNELMARVALHDSAYVRDNWRDLNWGADDISAVTWLKMLKAVAPFIPPRDFLAFQGWNIVGLATKAVGRGDEAYAALGAHSLLIDFVAENGNDKDKAGALWTDLMAANRFLDQGEVAVDSEPQVGQATWFKALLPAAVVMLFGVLAGQVWALSRKRSDYDLSISDGLTTLFNWQQGRATRRQALMALSHLGAEMQKQQQPILRADGTELNESERIVLQSIRDGEPPKTLAQRVGWSPKYVYTLRSRLRNHLDIPAKKSLEDWINEHED